MAQQPLRAPLNYGRRLLIAGTLKSSLEIDTRRLANNSQQPDKRPAGPGAGRYGAEGDDIQLIPPGTTGLSVVPVGTTGLPYDAAIIGPGRPSSGSSRLLGGLHPGADSQSDRGGDVNENPETRPDDADSRSPKTQLHESAARGSGYRGCAFARPPWFPRSEPVPSSSSAFFRSRLDVRRAAQRPGDETAAAALETGGTSKLVGSIAFLVRRRHSRLGSFVERPRRNACAIRPRLLAETQQRDGASPTGFEHVPSDAATFSENADGPRVSTPDAAPCPLGRRA